MIEGYPFVVVGVAPPGFFGETLQRNPPDLWIPIQQEPLITDRRRVVTLVLRSAFARVALGLLLGVPARNEPISL